MNQTKMMSMVTDLQYPQPLPAMLQYSQHHMDKCTQAETTVHLADHGVIAWVGDDGHGEARPA